MRKKIVIVLIGLMTLSSFNWRGKFPKFSLLSYQGSTFTEEVFKGKTTIVALYHLACPPAMVLMNDLDSLNQTLDTSKVQIIAILENTQNHLVDFYSDSATLWTPVRRIFKVKEVSYTLLPECQTENIVRIDTNTIIGQHCRIISKKVHTKDSPTLMLVNEKGNIIKMRKGYISHATINERMELLTAFYK